MEETSRRTFILQSALLTGALTFGLQGCRQEHDEVLEGLRNFIARTARPDGTFQPGTDPDYPGTSDTRASGIAAPTYATILSATFGWDLPYAEETKAFFIGCQQPDGAFYAPSGNFDQQSPLAKLYNTTQSVVALRLLGATPSFDPEPVISYFFEEERFTKLPLYTTSFFPLFYSALGRKMPAFIDQAMRDYILREQKEDGYLQDHVASTFHAAHYFRCIGKPTPRSREMVERVLRDQKSDGSWAIKEPDWDVHACFDALYILRQLGDPNDPSIQKAFSQATQWILSCQKQDGGFSHYPDGTFSDMDAVYFHAGGLVMAGYLPTSEKLVNEEILGWGHAMDPGKQYSCID